MFSAAMQPSSRSPDISAEPPEQWLYGSTASSSMIAWPVVVMRTWSVKGAAARRTADSPV